MPAALASRPIVSVSGRACRGGQHVAAVAGPEVDREAVVARRQRVESADVHVVEAAASEHGLRRV